MKLGPAPRSLLARLGGLAVLLITLLFLPGDGRGERALPTGRREVVSRSRIVGVHTRLTDEVEEWKVAKTLTMVREMGASWIVEYFPWAYIERSKGVYDWDHADMVIAHAYAQGLTVIARIDLVPAWARPARLGGPEATTARYLDPSRYGDYGDFIYAFVGRYKGKVRYFVIWNEPNVAFEWGYRPVSAKEYTELLRIAYTRAKESDPEAQVLAAGLAPTLGDGQWGTGDLEYLQQMYDAGAGEYFDTMAVHAYGWKSPPDDPAGADKINYARVELIRQVMVRNGDARKPIIITESGWNDHPRWTKAVRPGQRIQYTLRAYQKAEEEWPWVQAVNLWCFRLPMPARNYNDYFTLVRTDFTPKLIYNAVREWATGQKQGLRLPTLL